MNKAELLKELAEEYKKSVRLRDDISLKDYRDTIERETGLHISSSTATRTLNQKVERGEFETFLVAERGKIIRVWRKVEKKRKRKKA